MNIEEVIKATKEIPLAKKTFLNILYTEKLVSESILELLKIFDLSIEQYNVLRILKGQNFKPISMGLIQERMLAKKSNTTRLVDKLLLKELVSRSNCLENRRIIHVTITQKGVDLLNKLNPVIDDKENNYALNLTIQELETLNYLLEKYRNSNHG